MLMAVAAFGGYDLVKKAYETALEEKYKFGPYGDCAADNIKIVTRHIKIFAKHIKIIKKWLFNP